MPNIRILADNAAVRATPTASSTAGSLAAANLIAGKKSSVWRASVTTPTLTLTWPTDEVVSCFAMLCNGSPSMTIHVTGFNAANAQVVDTYVQYACPAPAVKLRGFTAAQAASAYAFGGGAIARVWFTPATVRRLVIEFTDPGNLQGYIEGTCLMTGAHWEASKNADYGASAQPVDTTQNFRTDAGDLLSNLKPRNTKLSIPMAKLTPTDSATLWDILVANGIGYPVFVSMFPEDADFALERRHQVIGKLVSTPVMALPSFRVATATLEIESI